MISRFWLGLKVFVCYVLPFLPCCPKVGKLGEGDCIWIQAFGRNRWLDDELGKILWEIRKKASSLIEALTFLKYSGFEPGKANRALGKKGYKLARLYGLEISSQWEVVYCIWELNPVWFLDHLSEIHCIWPPELGYFATRDVKLCSREWMKTKGKKRPIELCHPAMAARAIPIIWKLGVNVIVESVSIFSFWKDELWVWDEDSIQPWTRKFIRSPIQFLRIRDFVKESSVSSCGLIGFFGGLLLSGLENWWLPRESVGRFFHHLPKRWISFVQPAPAQ